MKCWICRRTPEEIQKDLNEILESDISTEYGLLSEMIAHHEAKNSIHALLPNMNIYGDNIPVCQVCADIFYQRTVGTMKSELDGGGEIVDAVIEILKIEFKDMITDWLK